LLKAPTHTPPQSKPPSPFSCHRGWAMGRGRGMRREGVENFIVGLVIIILRFRFQLNYHLIIINNINMDVIFLPF